MESSLTIRPAQRAGFRATPTRERVSTELSEAIAAASDSDRHDEQPHSEDHPRELPIDPEGREVIYRAVDVSTHETGSDELLARQRAYMRSPAAAGGAEPPAADHADLEV